MTAKRPEVEWQVVYQVLGPGRRFKVKATSARAAAAKFLKHWREKPGGGFGFTTHAVFRIETPAQRAAREKAEALRPKRERNRIPGDYL
jgi:hypothetical protein